MSTQPRANSQKYDNILVLHPDGTPMFKGSKKLIAWYETRELAVQIDEKTYQLTFIPNGYGKGKVGSEFFLEDLKNQCVVCGAPDNLVRVFIVPHCYREALHKAHDHYDVLLLCVKCHKEYEPAVQYLMAQLAKEYGVSLNGWAPNEKAEREAHNKARKLSSLAHTVLKHSDKIHSEKLAEIYLQMGNLSGKKVRSADLVSLAAARPVLKLTNWISHGELVVRKVADKAAFEERWRQHFVDMMCPGFLPEHWKVKRND